MTPLKYYPLPDSKSLTIEAYGIACWNAAIHAAAKELGHVDGEYLKAALLRAVETGAKSSAIAASKVPDDEPSVMGGGVIRDMPFPGMGTVDRYHERDLRITKPGDE